MKKSFILFFFILPFIIFDSCNSNELEDNFSKVKNTSKIEWEMSKLTSESELDQHSLRGDDNCVDWQLSKEFAQLWLEDSIEANEYPLDSELWNIPVAIYGTNGKIKFYEFRIVSEGQIVGVIVGAAEKSYGCPIVYETKCNGYADEISNLYNNGKLLEDELPRIIDDGYPNVVFGVIKETKGAANEFSSYLTTDGNYIEESDITSIAGYEEVSKKYSEYFLDDTDDKKMQALINDYEKNAEVFWQMAVEKKGHIADFATRGKAKSERTELDRNCIVNTLEKDIYGNLIHIFNYKACGPVAAGFVLDYIQKNSISDVSVWSKLSESQKEAELYSKMRTGKGLVAGVVKLCGQDGGSVTMPNNLSGAINYYSRYTLKVSQFVYPKKSINDNLPGISLRVFGDGGCHYRPVIGYKRNGWGPFCWPSFKILDLADCKDKINGSWETYIPVYHYKNWDVVRK